MVEFNGFDPALTRFLTELRAHNTREWFAENKQRYEDLVREPALDFISAMGQPLARIAPYFVAVPKKTGGSLMRIHRDIRFARDKTPYKTNVGIQFRHERGKDAHAPGYYVHIDPDEAFVGAGIWHPDPTALKSIRTHIVEQPDAWAKVRRSRNLRRSFEFAGTSLQRPPRGFAAEHEWIDDLKRKDFIVVHALDHRDLYRKDAVARIGAVFRDATPLMSFLCAAVGVRF